MSNTNLTDDSQLYCFFLNCKKNYLGDGEKPGDATETGEKGELSVAEGNLPMNIPISETIIDETGNRDDGTKISDENLKKKRERMKKINELKLKEQKSKGKRPSGNGRESR